MLFNSAEFFIFLLIVFVLYWRFKGNIKVQNVIILVSSYVFYGWWDIRFLLLIFVSSLTDYLVGIQIFNSKNWEKKLYLGLSLIINLGLLVVFKYYNFFIDSFEHITAFFGITVRLNMLHLILPVGISFYTFQTLSYSLDIYRGKIKPTKNFINFFGYVSFFPQLVAGPIERAANLLPQFEKKRTFRFENAADGMRLIIYGLFKKIVIADNLGSAVDNIFTNYEKFSGLELCLGAMYFIIQLYCDFSGYSDIAIGTAKLFGFKLMTNFKVPLFSKSIPEFWNRWHISLTTWFRDYLFIPLAKYKKNSLLWRIIATIILYIIIGFWHGANYTFLLFGLLMGIYYIPKYLSKNYTFLRKTIKFLNNNRIISPLVIFSSFFLLSFTTILFRSPNIESAFDYMSHIFVKDFFKLGKTIYSQLPMIIAFLTFEWIMKDKKHQFDIRTFNKNLRVFLYVALILVILLFGNFGKDPFFYFQF